MIIRIPELLQNEIDKYFNLQIGGKSVRCPYYINPKISPGNLRVMSGKGTAEEIELEVKIWAKIKHFDLTEATEEDIRQFMMKMKIGVDCSGFVVNVFNGYLKTTGKSAFIKFLKFENNSLIEMWRRFLKPVQNIGASMITSDLNTFEVDNLNDIRPGDVIKFVGDQRNSNHIALITEVEFEGDRIIRLKYVNSNSNYEDQNGMRYGEVLVDNPDSELKSQQWHDTINGRNYLYEALLINYEQNGIRRFKFAEQIF